MSSLGMQSHFVCNGCRSVLLYPRGVTNVCCGVCNTITAFPPPEMARLVCGGCRTLLVYSRVATNVRCTCCNTMNIARPANQVAHVSCGLCHTMLVYPYGAPSVKCAICHYVTNIWIDSMRVPLPAEYRSSESSPAQQPASAHPQEKNITVVVENPMSMDESGKLVTNLVVGVAIGKK